jgi:hypothetical protein
MRIAEIYLSQYLFKAVEYIFAVYKHLKSLFNMETMELSAYIFFISLFAVTIAVGIWLEKGKYRGKI